MTLLSLRAGEAVAAPGPKARSPRRGEAALAWREARNKLAAYWLVRTRGSGPPPAPGASWDDLVAAVYRRDPWSALFKLERLGIDLVAAAWPPRAPPPRGLLAGPRAAELPEGSLILLHGGMG